MKTEEEKQQERDVRDRMRPVVRDIFAQIDTIFARGGRRDKDGNTRGYYSPDATAARQLWDVLSALRGPDYEIGSDKNATTAVIRAAAFPKTFSGGERAIIIPAHMAYDEVGNAQTRLQMTESHHFKSHAKKAFKVLGLDWYDLNSRAMVDDAATPFKKRKTSKSKTRKSRS